MNTRFKVFASYNILQYLCDLIYPCSYICNCLKMPKKSQINEHSDPTLPTQVLGSKYTSIFVYSVHEDLFCTGEGFEAYAKFSYTI